MIPRYVPTYSYREINQSLLGALHADRTEILETKIREYFKVDHAFILDSGKQSLFILLRAFNRPGKVVTPAYNCNVVPEAAMFAGYSVRLLDPDISTMNVNHNDLKKSFSNEVAVIIAVSLFGIPYDVRPLKDIAAQKNIMLIEDVAAGMGSRIDGKLTGTIGDAGVISFHDTKALSGKTGGAIITNDHQLADKIRKILKELRPSRGTFGLYLSSMFKRMATRRWVYPVSHSVYSALHGEAMYEAVRAPLKAEPGYFKKGSRFSVELVLNQWEKIEENFSRRRAIANRYSKALRDHPAFQLPEIPEGVEPAWIQFPLLVRNKLRFYKYMQKHGVDITWTYRYSCAMEFPQEDCPNAEKIARSILSLPCYPDLTDIEVSRICELSSRYREEMD